MGGQFFVSAKYAGNKTKQKKGPQWASYETKQYLLPEDIYSVEVYTLYRKELIFCQSVF